MFQCRAIDRIGVADMSWSCAIIREPYPIADDGEASQALQAHHEKQSEWFDQKYQSGSRDGRSNELVRYVVEWRLRKCFERIDRANKGIDKSMSLLVLCGGDGLEGSTLADMGFANVTISDISSKGVEVGLKRDPRLKGLVLNAEATGLEENAFDMAIIQDGLHHLSRPVQGYTEMLRVSRLGVVFLEPHESMVGRVIGTEWEVNGDALNYVFRWDNKLVNKVTKSLLLKRPFRNLSFTCWHHNPSFFMLGKIVGKRGVAAFKKIMDIFFSRFGNQFCCIVLKG